MPRARYNVQANGGGNEVSPRSISLLAARRAASACGEVRLAARGSFASRTPENLAAA